MPYTRRALLSALSGVAGLSTLRPVRATGRLADPLGVRADFPVANTSLFLNSAYITPTPIPVVDAGREFAVSKAKAKGGAVTTRELKPLINKRTTSTGF